MEAPSPVELEAQESKRLYKSCLDIADSLLTKTPEAEHADEFAEAMREFCHGQTLVSRVFSKEKGWNPKHQWQSGEHSGFVVQMRNQKGQTLFINIYGGLRIATKGSDLRDSDLTNTNIHNHRTEKIISNPTNVFMRLVDNSGDVRTEISFFREPDQVFSLRNFSVKGENGQDKRNFPYRKITFGNQDYGFEQVSQSFSQSCNFFIARIESFIRN